MSARYYCSWCGRDAQEYEAARVCGVNGVCPGIVVGGYYAAPYVTVTPGAGAVFEAGRPGHTISAPAEETKPSNPKDAIGSSKAPLHLWPMVATLHGSLGLADGMLKYGRDNFREIGVRASIYYDAAVRHLAAWFEGEKTATDSGVHHLGHALACLAILLDAEAAGKLHDDRKVTGGYAAALAEWTPLVAELKRRHADKEPKHYTIADNRPG